MRINPARSAFSALLALAVFSCTDSSTSPRSLLAPHATARHTLTSSAGSVVISQVYGGGGNSGATLKNDFIELFNPGSDPADIGGWSVQYASANGTSWQVTPIPANTSVPAGGYFLIQEAAGTGTAPSLPTPDVSGSINLSGSDGKVALVSNTSALSGACPNGVTTIDMLSFGGGNCFPGDGSPTPPLSSTLAAIRNLAGCMYTADVSVDFATAAPSPRNSATPAHLCGTPNPATSLTITPSPTANAVVGSTVKLRAIAKDASNAITLAAVTWSTSDASIATVSQFGLVSGVSAGTATITAGTSNGGVSANTTVTVSAADVVISQVYGGGGNAGSVYKNDFIEVFNRGTQPVNLGGWSVQYGSAGGSSWQVTNLTGTIQPGAYFLVQESAGGGGTTALPTPNASASIMMSATDGKVLLARTTTAQVGSCPTGGAVADIVSYGNTNCAVSSTQLTNTTAELRLHNGCSFSGNVSVDFVAGPASPRNSSSPAQSCVPGAFDHVAISGASTVIVGSTTKLTAAARDANDLDEPNAVIIWSSSDETLATVDAGGLVTGVASSATPVVITATATVGGVQKASSLQILVQDPGIHWIDVSSSSASFPPGFQTQLFATARDKSGGQVIPATFTFEPADPTIADIKTVGNSGIITGVSAPADATKPGFKITATPIGGGTSYSFTTHPVTIETPVPAPLTIYAKNDEFGDPTAATADTPDDFLIVRPQYTISYNQSRGTPNWVSYELDARQMVAGQDRCNCFTADPLLPVAKQIFTSDYTSGGFDRGHMTRSADRTAGNVDNAETFYLTNVVPQQADLNQGVWAAFENTLADSAKAGRAVYIITGPLYSHSHGLTFLKSEGKVAIPDSTWKVALIGARNGSGIPFTHGSIQTWDDLAGTTVLAVNMPNVSGVRNDPWQKYLTTVHKIETATGYDFLNLLPSAFQFAVEAGDHAPTAHFVGPTTVAEGTGASFDASATTDPDLGRTDLERTEALSYVWSFSDGTTASGKAVSHTFAKYGTYTASLTVTDAFGWQSVATQSVAVTNVAPVVGAFSGATLLPGETYTASLAFTDPGNDPFGASVVYGDGSSSQSLAIDGRNLSLSHQYTAAGTFTVTVTVSDGAATATGTATVIVETPAQAIASLSDEVNAFAAAAGLNQGEINSLQTKLRAASGQLAKGDVAPATNTLDAFMNELGGLVSSQRATAAAVTPLISLAQRIVTSISR